MRFYPLVFYTNINKECESFYRKLSPWEGVCDTACWLRSALDPDPSFFHKDLEVNKSNKHTNCFAQLQPSVRKEAGWVQGLWLVRISWQEAMSSDPVFMTEAVSEVHLYRGVSWTRCQKFLTEGQTMECSVFFLLNWKPMQRVKVGNRYNYAGQAWPEGTISGHFWPFFF